MGIAVLAGVIRGLRPLVLLPLLLGLLPITAGAEPVGPALIKIDLAGPIAEIDLPIYAHLTDAAGQEYLLTIADPGAAALAGRSFRMLDSAADWPVYLIARERRKGAREEAARRFEVLLDDGRQILVRDVPGIRDRLGEMGFEFKALPREPMVLAPPTPLEQQEILARRMAGVTYSAAVAQLMAEIDQTALYDEVGNLSGENSVLIGGAPYTVAGRATGSAGLAKATQYVYERMGALGLAVSYHNWSNGGYSGRNVIGSLAGVAKPGEIVLVTAHLDDRPATQPAPGADDNASGATGVLALAQVLSKRLFDRSLRFILFTGEEQGLLGSEVYATAAAAAGESIVAVYNLDMIGWDAVGGPALRLYTRSLGSPGYSADRVIADTFTGVVTTYGLASVLDPILVADSYPGSDQASFWDRNYPGIMAIEDDWDDFNPYYHTAGDKRQYLNMAYMANYVRASAGTVAHLALGPRPPAGYAISTAVSPIGGGTLSCTPNPVPSDGTSSCTAAANAGYGFYNWAGDCAGATGPVCTLSHVTSAKSVTANFALLPPELQNRTRVMGMKGAAGGMQYYRIQVPSGATNLAVDIRDGSGNANLYVRREGFPTFQSFDCAPRLGGNAESCAFPAPTAGTWYIGLHAAITYAGLTLTVGYDAGPACSVGVDHLVLQNQAIVGVRSYDACRTITAGPGLTVGSGGNLGLRAGERIKLAPGSGAVGGGVLRAWIDSSLAPQ